MNKASMARRKKTTTSVKHVATVVGHSTRYNAGSVRPVNMFTNKVVNARLDGWLLVLIERTKSAKDVRSVRLMGKDGLVLVKSEGQQTTVQDELKVLEDIATRHPIGCKRMIREVTTVYEDGNKSVYFEFVSAEVPENTNPNPEARTEHEAATEEQAEVQA